METEEFKTQLETRKFNWMNFGLIGIGSSIALLTLLKNNIFILLAMFTFVILVIFEAIGLRVIEKNYPNLGRNSWYVRLYFYYSTFWDIILLIIALVLLGLGVYSQ